MSAPHLPTIGTMDDCRVTANTPPRRGSAQRILLGASAGGALATIDVLAAVSSGSAVPLGLWVACVTIFATAGGALGLVLAAARRSRPLAVCDATILFLFACVAYAIKPTLDAVRVRGWSDAVAAAAIAAGVAVGWMAQTHFRRARLSMSSALALLMLGSAWLVLVRLLPKVLVGQALSISGAVVALLVTLAALGVAVPVYRRGTRLPVMALACLAALAPWLVPGAAASAALRNERMAPFTDHAREHRPNVMVVVLDTVRSDQTSLGNPSATTTPFLTSLAGDSVVYAAAVSTSTWSLPAHASLLTGVYPHRHGADCFASTPGGSLAPAYPQRLDPRRPTLAALLGRAGYRTALVASNWLFLGREYGLADSFQHVAASPRVRVRFPSRAVELSLATRLEIVRRLAVAYRPAPEIEHEATQWLRQQDERPFFLLVNFMDAHSPYLSAQPQRWRLFWPRPPTRPVMSGRRDASAQEQAFFLAAYRRQIAAEDNSLRRLVMQLKTMGAYDDTLIVVTSDHGEYFGEHRLWEHGWGPYRQVLDVPLLVKYPGQSRRGRSGAPASLVDIYATVLNAAGLPSPADVDARVLGTRTDPPIFEQCVSAALLEQFGSRFARAFAGMKIGDALTVRYSPAGSPPRSSGELQLDRILAAAARNARSAGSREVENRQSLRALGYAN